MSAAGSSLKESASPSSPPMSPTFNPDVLIEEAEFQGYAASCYQQPNNQSAKDAVLASGFRSEALRDYAWLKVGSPVLAAFSSHPKETPNLDFSLDGGAVEFRLRSSSSTEDLMFCPATGDVSEPSDLYETYEKPRQMYRQLHSAKLEQVEGLKQRRDNGPAEKGQREGHGECGLTPSTTTSQANPSALRSSFGNIEVPSGIQSATR